MPFRDATRREDNFEYWKSGIFHFCMQAPDVEGMAVTIVAAGGKQRMPVREYFSARSHIVWFIWKIRSEIFLKFTDTVMS
ncbi:hypothetical protein ACFFW8_00530 [Erwinia tracheiphila]